MSLRRAQAEISAAEFAEWQAFYAIEPFGEERADLRAAIIAATVANSMRVKGRVLTPADFMPDFGDGSKRQTAQEMEAILRSYCERKGKQKG